MLDTLCRFYFSCEGIHILLNTISNTIIQGELAIAFGDLLKKLWSSGRNPVAPRSFKTKLARFAPQFSGYNQHDSQVSHLL